MINMEKDKTINLIAGRIIDEYRKHSELNWSLIAAQKIYSQWNDFYDQQTKELQQRVEQLQFELKAADSVNEQLQAKIDELESINNDLKQAMIRGSELNDKLEFDEPTNK